MQIILLTYLNPSLHFLKQSWYLTVMNLVATHYISFTTLQLHITYGLHLPSFTALTHSHPPLHQSHSCHQSLVSTDCLTTPAPHSHTHTHIYISSTLPCTHRKVLFLPRLTFLSVYHSLWLLLLCLTPDCPTLELWTCACDLDPCLVLFTSLLCLWYSCYCQLTTFVKRSVYLTDMGVIP